MDRRGLKKLIRDVYFNNLEKTRTLLEKLEDKSVIEDIGMYTIPTPLCHITLFNEAIWRDVDYWTEDIRPAAAAERQKCLAMIEFWKDYYGVKTLPAPDYFLFDHDFFKSDLDETVDEAVFYPRSEWERHNLTEKDAELFLAVCQFDFRRAEALLRAGANPCAEVGDDYCCFTRVGWKIAHLCSCEVQHTGFGQQIDESSFRITYPVLDDLLGLAAYMEMERLLERHSDSTTTTK